MTTISTGASVGGEHGRAEPCDALLTEPTPSSEPVWALESGLGFRLGRAHREVRASWESRLTDLHLSSPQASLLRAVAEKPGTGLRELARKLHTDPMNAKRIADGLEGAGLICSCDDPTDKRRRVLGPTDSGRAMSMEVARRGRIWSATLEGLLGSEDAEDLRRILARLEAGVSGLLERTTPGDEANRA